MRRIMGTNMVFRYGGASAKLTWVKGNTYSLRNVWSRNRHQGHARGVLEEVVKYADENGLTLIAVAQRYGAPDYRAMTNKQLEAFYAKFGFVPYDETERPVWMSRQPSQDLHAL